VISVVAAAVVVSLKLFFFEYDLQVAVVIMKKKII